MFNFNIKEKSKELFILDNIAWTRETKQKFSVSTSKPIN